MDTLPRAAGSGADNNGKRGLRPGGGSGGRYGDFTAGIIQGEDDARPADISDEILRAAGMNERETACRWFDAEQLARLANE